LQVEESLDLKSRPKSFNEDQVEAMGGNFKAFGADEEGNRSMDEVDTDAQAECVTPARLLRLRAGDLRGCEHRDCDDPWACGKRVVAHFATSSKFLASLLLLEGPDAPM
jgi:hypothetical protein